MAKESNGKGLAAGSALAAVIATAAAVFTVNEFLQKPLENRIEAARTRFEDHLVNTERWRSEHARRLDVLAEKLDQQERTGTSISRQATQRLEELHAMLEQLDERIARLETGQSYRYQRSKSDQP